MQITRFRTDEPTRAGYAALVDHFQLDAIAHWRLSEVAPRGTHRLDAVEGQIRETFIARYWPGDQLGDHLEFALKYDGVNLAILATLFGLIDAQPIADYVQSKPTGKYARRVWYLYEWLTGERLPLEDLTQGNYVTLLEPKDYFTTSTPERIRRQRISDNLLGDRRFCPIVRRTDRLVQAISSHLAERCQQVVAGYSSDLLKRALSYLYTKETKSSFEIEHIQPSARRTERFIGLLQLAEKEDFCQKERLIELQHRIVDPRFQAEDYRTNQNYVGEAVAWQSERVHYACPKPEDVADLMAGLVAAHQRMSKSDVHPVVHAAAIAYGFVYLHPFEDGNGRIHRFLIHNILARRGFTPEDIMFPVSAAMLKHPAAYDASLEAFSKPLMPLVDYEIDEAGQMTVHNDTGHWYRYLDLTAQAEALFDFIENTIDSELVAELSFLANYDRTKGALQEIVDMPDRQIDLFIRFCLQNGGRLSSRKRRSHFEFLTDDEVESMERAVQAAYVNAESEGSG